MFPTRHPIKESEATALAELEQFAQQVWLSTTLLTTITAFLWYPDVV
jgi:hypothetical protein